MNDRHGDSIGPSDVRAVLRGRRIGAEVPQRCRNRAAPLTPNRLDVGRGNRTQPTSTAAATTVVQRPFLSPTAVWVTFWVRTISFESR